MYLRLEIWDSLYFVDFGCFWAYPQGKGLTTVVCFFGPLVALFFITINVCLSHKHAHLLGYCTYLLGYLLGYGLVYLSIGLFVGLLYRGDLCYLLNYYNDDSKTECCLITMD